MRIQSSNVAMESGRSYQAEQEVSLKSIQKHYTPDGEEDAAEITLQNTKTSVKELSGEAAVYTSSTTTVPDVEEPSSSGSEKASGGKKTPPGQIVREQNGAEKKTPPGQIVREQNGAEKKTPPGQIVREQNGAEKKTPPGQLKNAQDAAQAQASNWIDAVEAAENDPKIQLLRKCMELLESLNSRSNGYLTHNSSINRSLARMEANISSVVMRYRQSMAQGNQLAELAGEDVQQNGYWTRKVISSGFIRGEEHTAFQTTGTVVTADGRTLNFGLTMEMSRSFERAFASVGREAVYTDPLVLNMDTEAASLADVNFYFDLDCDGKKEMVSQLAGSKGFLALDKNGDGEINDGSELFGTKSGDGFADLAQYDQDGNGWIDENDDVFSKLRVWVHNGDGASKLLNLKDADVGAIFLGSSSTQFGLTDSTGAELGRIRSTGVYLKESGGTGAVQHVDFKT